MLSHGSLGILGQLSNIHLKQEKSGAEVKKESKSSSDSTKERKGLQEFYEEMPISKHVSDDNSVSVTARKCPETSKNIVSIETDLPGDVTVHWGVCKNGSKRWEIPSEPYPEETSLFKNKALRTHLQVRVEVCSLARFACSDLKIWRDTLLLRFSNFSL